MIEATEATEEEAEKAEHEAVAAMIVNASKQENQNEIPSPARI